MTTWPRWNEVVPRDRLGNLRFRAWLLGKARESAGHRRVILEACRQDPIFFICAFIWQYNPKHTAREVGPFITWGPQERWLKETYERLIVEQDDMLWEKSRELGATWLALILFLWLALFHPWKKFLCVSHSEDAVDRPGDKDSLFWKLDFMLDHLPAWMTRRVQRKKMSFNFRATESSINGVATTERAGVGGRATAILLDEFAKQRDDFKILGQTADTGPRLFVSTHYGVGTAFFELAQRPDLRKIMMHWSEHPEKNPGLYRVGENGEPRPVDPGFIYPVAFRFVTDGSPTGGPFPGLRSLWYDKECLRRANSRDVAMHLDIDAQGATSQFFDPLRIRSCAALCSAPLWEGDLNYNGLGEPLGLEERPGGDLKLWVMPNGQGRLPTRPYAGGTDISTGSGATPSCFSFVDAMTGEKVGHYVNARIEPPPFAILVVALCRFLEDDKGQGAYLVWESPGPGGMFGKKVLELGYRHLYYRKEHTKVFNKPAATSPGWYPGGDNKRHLLENYRHGLYSGEYLTRSEDELKESLNFRYNKRGDVEHATEESPSDPSGARQNHGDILIASALSWLGAKEMKVQQDVRQKQEGPPVLSLAWRRLQSKNDSGARASHPWL